jgi:hypothetical protein
VIFLKSATVRLDQRQSNISLPKPQLEFEVIFDVTDDKKGVMLEWANCFWSNRNKHSGRALRRVSLEFDYLGAVPGLTSRTFTIDRAFIAFFQEDFAQDPTDTNEQIVKAPSVKAIIRANNEEQDVFFSHDLEQPDTSADDEP